MVPERINTNRDVSLDLFTLDLAPRQRGKRGREHHKNLSARRSISECKAGK